MDRGGLVSRPVSWSTLIMQTSGKFYVYKHTRQTDGALFYVGKGSGKRAYSEKNRNKHWTHMVSRHGYDAHIVKSDMHEACAFSLEMALIASSNGNLVNVSTGGLGASGVRHTDASKAAISKVHKGRVHSKEHNANVSAALKGRTLSDEHRAKLSAAHMGQSGYWTGKRLSNETRAKIKAAGMGRECKPSTRAKLSVAHMGRPKSREAVEKFAEARRDKGIYSFVHVSGMVFTGTRHDFTAQHDLCRSKVVSIITGKRPSHKGWSISSQTGTN